MKEGFLFTLYLNNQKNNYMLINENMSQIINSFFFFNLTKFFFYSCNIMNQPINLKKFKNPIEISKGAFGIVHRVECPSQKNQFFAIKTITSLDETGKHKINKEIKIWENLSSLPQKPRSIPNFYGYQQEALGYSGVKFDLVFDYFPKSLQSVLSERKSKKPFPFKQLYKFYKSLINSLAFLQTMGICHRDLKPANLLLDEECENIYLIDFSESKEIIIQALEETTKQDLTLVGSPKYFSPELNYFFKQKKENVKLNPFKSDVFSLGLIMLEIGTGDSPKKEKDPVVWKKKVEEKIQEFKMKYKEILESSKERKILRNLVSALEDCLELEPDDRPDFKMLFSRLMNDLDDEKFRKYILLEEGFEKSENKISREKKFCSLIDIKDHDEKKEKKKQESPKLVISHSDIKKQEKLLEMYNKKESAQSLSIINKPIYEINEKIDKKNMEDFKENPNFKKKEIGKFLFPT